MKVYIPTQLRSYTGDQATVEVAGATLADLLAELDRRFPGLHFRIIDEQDRIRQHIIIYVNQARALSLAEPLRPQDSVRIIGALSGG